MSVIPIRLRADDPCPHLRLLAEVAAFAGAAPADRAPSAAIRPARRTPRAVPVAAMRQLAALGFGPAHIARLATPRHADAPTLPRRRVGAALRCAPGLLAQGVGHGDIVRLATAPRGPGGLSALHGHPPSPAAWRRRQESCRDAR